MTSLSDLPLRDELRGLTPYGAPQLDVAVRLNTNENSYPLPDEAVAEMEKALGAVLRDLNRYPDRDAVALRTDLAAYLRHGLTWRNVWAANGSNEIQQQLLQTFGGPGRTALGFTPSYSMHPLLAAGTGTAWVDGRRGDDFALTAEHAVAKVREHRPDVVFLCSPNNPTGTALDPAVVAAVLRRWGLTEDDREELIDQLTLAVDPRAERYWQLMAVINGWPPVPATMHRWEWFLNALRAGRGQLS